MRTNPNPPRIGDTVRLDNGRTIYEIIGGPDRKGRYQLASGALTIWAEAERISEATPSPKKKQAGPVRLPQQASSVTVDLHGKTVVEALELLEKTLDRALMEGASSIDVIHGLGTGALKNAVHNYLSQSKHVSRFQISLGNPGTTVVYL